MKMKAISKKEFYRWKDVLNIFVLWIKDVPVDEEEVIIWN